MANEGPITQGKLLRIEGNPYPRHRSTCMIYTSEGIRPSNAIRCTDPVQFMDALCKIRAADSTGGSFIPSDLADSDPISWPLWAVITEYADSAGVGVEMHHRDGVTVVWVMP